MAAAVPVIVNEEASYQDYPDAVIAKIPAKFSSDDIANALDKWVPDFVKRQLLGMAGRAYVATHHHPVKLAADYALAINEFIDRRSALTLSARRERLRDLRLDGLQKSDVEIAAREIDRQIRMATVSRRRLLIDVSHLHSTDHGTGIPRVVKSVLGALYQSERTDFEPVAVVLEPSGRVRMARELLERFGLFASGDAAELPIEIRQGDILLMLDSSWAKWSEFSEVHRQVRERGGVIITAVYDLLPILLPQYMVEGGPAWFAGWLRNAVAGSDAMICISRAVAEDLCRYVKEIDTDARRDLRIGYWHLGGDFIEARDATVSPAVKRAFGRPSFLMVGTMEPRKRHAVALDACEVLWRDRVDVNLVITGRRGWLVDEFMARLATHPELGRRLHLLEDIPDEDLRFAYRNALALLFPSAGEGFGLPLIEAAHHGLPAIANDLPVLREIGGDAVTYVCSDNAISFSRGIKDWMAAHTRGATPDPRSLKYLTWEQSADQLLSVVLDNRWYRTV